MPDLSPVAALTAMEGRTAIVTGGASGIGAATVRLLAGAGARVGVLDVDRERAEKVAAENPRCEPVVADLTSPAELEDAVADFLAAGPLHTLVNNAGNLASATPFDAADGDEWLKSMELHVRAVHRLTRIARPALRAAGAGAVVNVSSIGATHPLETMTHYCTAKGAVEALTRAMALELSPDGIRVNCVRPSGTDTPGSAALARSEAFQARRIERPDEAGRYLAVSRATPDHIARVLFFLASDLSSFINGQVIVVDGGYAIT